ncbi:hypothetical protein CVO_00420 [Sulfurimonas sp. CVO]|nr:hypothetical protein CVO_00420 [Sulfurimonas sp. CVO]
MYYILLVFVLYEKIVTKEHLKSTYFKDFTQSVQKKSLLNLIKFDKKLSLEKKSSLKYVLQIPYLWAFLKIVKNFPYKTDHIFKKNFLQYFLCKSKYILLVL